MKRLHLPPLVLLSGLLFVMFTTSCSKTGATGPAGPAGDSTTVIYSDWMDVKYKADTVMTGAKIDTIGYYAIISVPKLTTDLLSTADVKAFVNTSDPSDPVIYPLPYTGISGVNIEFSAYTQNIQLYSNGDVSTFTNSGKKYNQYRYMIVPGSVKASTSINWKDYTSVKTALGLTN